MKIHYYFLYNNRYMTVSKKIVKPAENPENANPKQKLKQCQEKEQKSNKNAKTQNENESFKKFGTKRDKIREKIGEIPRKIH